LSDKSSSYHTTASYPSTEYQKIIIGMGLMRENTKGNLIIHFKVKYPDVLSIEQIDKLKEIL
jgi:DnaJ-class molecular chaperone